MISGTWEILTFGVGFCPSPTLAETSRRCRLSRCITSRFISWGLGSVSHLKSSSHQPGAVRTRSHGGSAAGPRPDFLPSISNLSCTSVLKTSIRDVLDRTPSLMIMARLRSAVTRVALPEIMQIVLYLPHVQQTFWTNLKKCATTISSLCTGILRDVIMSLGATTCCIFDLAMKGCRIVYAIHTSSRFLFFNLVTRLQASSHLPPFLKADISMTVLIDSTIYRLPCAPTIILFARCTISGPAAATTVHP